VRGTVGVESHEAAVLRMLRPAGSVRSVIFYSVHVTPAGSLRIRIQHRQVMDSAMAEKTQLL